MLGEEVQWLQKLFVVLMLLVQLRVGSGSLSHVDVDDAGLPADTLGVYLPGKLQADKFLACPSTMAAAMN